LKWRFGQLGNPAGGHFFAHSGTKETPALGDFFSEKGAMEFDGEMNFGKRGNGIILAACREGNGFGLIGNAVPPLSMRIPRKRNCLAQSNLSLFCLRKRASWQVLGWRIFSGEPYGG
jgi:hypothetical protein